MQVELLRVVVVAVVGAVVSQVVLQAGPRGGGVAAAERNAVQQVAAVHVAPDATGSRGRKEAKTRERGGGSGWRCNKLLPVMLNSLTVGSINR